VALVQFGGDLKGTHKPLQPCFGVRCPWRSSQGHPLEKIHRFTWVSCSTRQSATKPVVFLGPRVSKARGWKMWENGRDEQQCAAVRALAILSDQSRWLFDRWNIGLA